MRSPKTERFAGHEQRFVPIVPRLMTLLEEWFDAAPEGEELLINIKGAGGRRLKMVAIMHRAGIEPRDDTWQTLRRSCEIERAQIYPQYAVSKWIGHSISVSLRHYANAIPGELYARAAGRQTTHIPTQYAAESGRTMQQIKNRGSEAA